MTRAHLWLASCKPASELRWAEQQAALFSTSENARLARISRPQRRAQFIAGHVLARQLLLFVLGREVMIDVADDGRPVLAAAAPWELSLSHSGAWVAALLSEGRAGVDIEVDRPLRDAAALRAWLDEKQSAHATEPVALDHATLRAWTLAEARLKAGVATPTFHTRWEPPPERIRALESVRITLWLAIAGVVDPPITGVADLAARSYNECRLTWHRVDDRRDDRSDDLSDDRGDN